MAALADGARVELIEKSTLPRHKVCGEFLSPETACLLDELGLWKDFLALGPAPMRRMIFHFGEREKRSKLPEQAWGLSRYALDELLFESAIRRGAQRTREATAPDARPVVEAIGRKAVQPRGSRLFGFKAHFAGPVDDAVELFFFSSCYAGVSPVENGTTNVCGLAPESLLREHAFDLDQIVRMSEPLRERMRPLARQWKWLTAGPLVFRNRFGSTIEAGIYPAGDALSFVDPFTGSGILSAMLTGRLAGIAAARGTPVEQYLADCRRALGRQFQISRIFRHILASGWAPHLAPLVPGDWLFRLTRPR